MPTPLESGSPPAWDMRASRAARPPSSRGSRSSREARRSARRFGAAARRPISPRDAARLRILGHVALVSDPVSQVGLSVAILLAVAKIGGDIATRLRQPAVLGELLGGIVLGSIPLQLLVQLRTDASVDMLARLGVLILLFQVGLDSTVRDVVRVGVSSAAVAVLGTAGTLLAGWGAATLVLPHASLLLRLFFAAALTATSIGISARVLKDAGAARRPEALTILGASVLDDILGLVVLAIVSSAVTHAAAGRRADLANVAGSSARPSSSSRGRSSREKLSPLLFRLTAKLRTEGALVATGLAFCFVLAWASDAIGLAPIVGAFTAGLILEESHSARFVARGERLAVGPDGAHLVVARAVFFVLMGMRADFARWASADAAAHRRARASPRSPGSSPARSARRAGPIALAWPSG